MKTQRKKQREISTRHNPAVITRSSTAGITLVALVVTIIVLIILATISINIIFREGGILEKALEGQEAQKMADAREKVQLMLTDYIVEREVNKEKLMDYLLKQKEKGTLVEVTDNEDGTITVQVDGYQVTIKEETLEILDDVKTSTPTEEETTVTKVILIKDLVGKEASNTNITAEDEYGNLITIPSGFTVLANGTNNVRYTYTGDENSPAVQDGIVVQDSEGNEFVWIPIGVINNKSSDTNGVTKEITLGRYEFDSSGNGTLKQDADSYEEKVLVEKYYSESKTSSYGKLEEFITTTQKNRGYYIARYEASKNSEDKTQSKEGEVWTAIKFTDALNAATTMYEENEFYSSDLINSYAYDTAIIFSQLYGRSDLMTILKDNSDFWNTMALEDLSNVGCNICDLASNHYEWSTEYSDVASDRPYTMRQNLGISDYGQTRNGLMVNGRGSLTLQPKDNVTFRVILIVNSQ